MDRRWLVAIGLVVIAVLWYSMRVPAGERITSTEAHRMVAGGARLLDVRTRAEFRAGHIEGAINIPLQELGKRLGELNPTEQPVVLYCRSGRRSGLAKAQLKKAGFKAVYDLGPKSAW